MIAIINGKLLEKKPTEIIIDCNGVGYSLFISLLTSSKLPEIGSNVKLRTVLIPREDQFLLFGFWDESEKEMFKELINIAGIGPKTAIGILSAVSPNELASFIENENLKALQKLPGIGKKSAERMLVELKDRVSKLNIERDVPQISETQIKDEALAALCALGYNKIAAEKAIKSVLKENSQIDDIETLIKLSLKFAMDVK